HQICLGAGLGERGRDHELDHAKPPDSWQARDELVHQRGDQWQVLGKENKAMFSNRAETGEFQEAANVVFADPVGLDKLGAKADLAGEIENWLPQVVVVDNDDLRVRCAMATHALEGAQDVDGVEDMVENDVVKGFAEIESFGIAGEEMEVRMVAPRDFDHRLADFDAETVGGSQRGKQCTCLAANLEHPGVRFDDGLPGPLEVVIEVVVRANPFVAASGDGFLMTA